MIVRNYCHNHPMRNIIYNDIAGIKLTWNSKVVRISKHFFHQSSPLLADLSQFMIPIRRGYLIRRQTHQNKQLLYDLFISSNIKSCIEYFWVTTGNSLVGVTNSYLETSHWVMYEKNILSKNMAELISIHSKIENGDDYVPSTIIERHFQVNLKPNKTPLSLW